ncbi:uncharacterized protein B0H18DRAFT_1116270 [Fomitopsis serialis]|uniref:uncharacterized protein n=1 Tax=Fomitopsis serialis TaxID=139415 RepID=UPI0020086002|nr:uncharacterized protein B0H18DRAFT_1116270 [Neoantrodia serialis]KAH9931464.1 hypothetical protein B0H18DRAFT_1116270 [Neoantrodia serialis]
MDNQGDENRPRVADPSGEVCPNYAGPAYAPFRQMLVERGMTVEDATQALKDGWQAEYNQRLEAWQTQVQADIAAAEAQHQRMQEEAARNLAAEQQVREEERRAMDKKKPKLARIISSQPPPDTIRDRISEYARDKLAKLGYVELDYFTAKAKSEASTYSKTVADDAMLMMRGEGSNLYNFVPAAAGRAQKVRADADLPFAEFLLTWQGFLAELETLPLWPREHIDQYQDFLVAIVGHVDNQEAVGQAALMLYVDSVRHEWHRKVLAKDMDDTLFNISKFNHNLYNSCRRTVESKRHREAVESVRIRHAAVDSSR